MKNYLYISANRTHYFILLAILVLAFRFPYWFIDVINWDESTFAIMGKGLINGSLPYTDLWDLKPPLAFVQIGLFLSLFGESVLAIRLGGAVYILATSILIFLITEILFNRRAALVASVLYILTSSLYWGGQSTYTEHLAILPVIAAMYLLISRRVTYETALSIGLLISIAVLTRLNLAYLALSTGLLILIYTESRIFKQKLLFGFAYAAAGIIPLVTLLAIYILSDNLDLLKIALIDAPLSYATEQNNFLRSSLGLIWQLLRPINTFPYLTLNHVVSLCSLLGLVILVRSLFKKNNSLIGNIGRKALFIVITFFAATAYSMASSGASHGHYLIQITPFLSIFSSAFFFYLDNSKYKVYANFIPVTLIAFAVFGWIRGPLVQFEKLYNRVEATNQYFSGLSYWAEDIIKKQSIPNYSLYAMSYHIIYFTLDKKPPTPLSTHPSNIFKPFLISALSQNKSTPKNELIKILDQHPTFIVKNSNIWYMKEYPDESHILEKYLNNYMLIGQKYELQIFKINKNVSD